MKILDTTIRSFKKRLLEYLLDLSTKLELSVNPGKKDNKKSLTIDRQHRVVLNSSKVFNQEYLSIFLQCLKMPQKQEREWLQLATNDVTEQLSVRFMHDGNNKKMLRRLQTNFSMTLTTRGSVGACCQLGQSGMTGFPGLEV